jgi:molybdenum cofactor biosynthesis enzyme
MALPTDEKVSAFSQVRVGVLRRIVQLYPGEEIDGLKGVLRSWRSLGGRVTRKTTEELVGRLCHLNKVDLAVELINDRTQCTSTLTLTSYTSCPILRVD